MAQIRTQPGANQARLFKLFQSKMLELSSEAINMIEYNFRYLQRVANDEQVSPSQRMAAIKQLESYIRWYEKYCADNGVASEGDNPTPEAKLLYAKLQF
ncbi:hypothetical protein D3C81_745780 [compost metagenome]